MKRFTILVVILVAATFVNAQKHDKNWVLGLDNIGTAVKPYNKGFIMSFEPNGIEFRENKNNMRQSRTNISMSDENGKLQFFTNGSFINNHQFQLMENGRDILAPNSFVDIYGYLAHKAFSCLPDNKEHNIYYIYQDYVDAIEIPDSSKIDTNEVTTRMYLAKIDMNANGGLGKVQYKGKVGYDDQYYYRSEFVRHGNGKLWWSVLNHVNGREYSSLLWDNDSLLAKRKYVMSNNEANVQVQSNAQKCFSQDGTMYVDLGGRTEIRIFGFNRCNGELTLKNRIPFEDAPKWGKKWNWLSIGIAISPNNRYLYLGRGIENPNLDTDEYVYVCQIDLEEPDPWKNRIILLDKIEYLEKESGTTYGAFPWWFTYGADGGLYFINNSENSVLYTIKNPNEKGKLCNLCDTCINYPFLNEASIPKNPNYRLGPLKGSPCDTLKVGTKDLEGRDYGLKLVPNPATDKVQIDITLPAYDTDTKTDVVVLDVAGEVVLRYVMPDFAYFATVDISALASGVYAVQLRQRNQVMAVEKLVVVR